MADFVVDPGARISSDAVVGDNSVIEVGCVVGYPTTDSATRGRFGVTIGRDAHLRESSVVYWGTSIGERFHCGHKANIRERCRIGNDVSIGTLTVIERDVTIGSGVRIHSQAFLPEYTVIEDDVFIGPNVVFTNARYPGSPLVKKELAGPIVRSGAIIGANATILPGVVVGANAIVGAGSVVTHDVPDRSVVAGNPARIINSIETLSYD